jgi:DUF4097 and DUF4098 domain-containing protein YvlB
MSRWVKKLLYTGLCLTAVGTIIFLIGYCTSNNRNFYIKLQNWKVEYGEYEENTSVINKLDFAELEAFSDVSISVEDIDIEFVSSDSYGISYTLYGENVTYDIKDNVLNISDTDKTHGNVYIWNMDFRRSSDKENVLTIYYPDTLNNISIKNEYGDVNIYGDVICGKLDINNDSGDINIQGDISCENFTVDNGSGDANINGVTVKEFSADLEYGDLNISNCNMSDISISMESGDCNIKNCNIYGNVNITEEFGDVNINSDTVFQPEDSYGYNIETELGDVIINGHTYESGVYKENTDKTYVITIKNECGGIKLN